MLDYNVRILDVDGSVAQQQMLLHRLGPNAHIVGLRDLEASLRFMSTHAARQSFERALKPAHRNRLTFLGSGDFHHLSSALVAQWKTPLSLIVFDNHPDWDITSPWHCCGCWINEVLARPNIRRVAVIGLGPTDLHGWHILRGNLKAVQRQKLELFPWSFARSKTLFAPSRNLPCASLRARGPRTEIHWKTVAQNGLPAIMNSVLDRLPTREVYVSIDKDCLQAKHAVTNWEEGEVSLEDLCAAITTVAQRREIVGADIIGEWSSGPIANPLFRAIARADHPSDSNHRPSSASLRANEQTNLALLDVLLNTPQMPHGEAPQSQAPHGETPHHDVTPRMSTHVAAGGVL